MHSRIIELKREPVEQRLRIAQEDIPESFFSTVGDYVTNLSGGSRMETIQWLREYLSDEVLETSEAEKIVLKPGAKMAYFRKKHTEFCQLARRLSSVCLNEFSGSTPSRMGFEMYRLNHLYNDTCSFYVFDEYELQPLDNWLRHADLAVPYYIGGTLDYHF